MLPIALTFCAAAFLVFFLWIHFVSRGEREMTAARRSLLMAVLVPVPYLVTAWVVFPGAVFAGFLLLALPCRLMSRLLMLLLAFLGAAQGTFLLSLKQ